MKTMSNLLNHKHEDDGDGSSSGNGKCKCRTRRICTKNGCNYGGHRQKSVPDWVVLSKERPDDAREISIWEGADRCSEYLGVK